MVRTHYIAELFCLGQYCPFGELSRNQEANTMDKKKDEELNNSSIQPSTYSKEELAKLRDFIDVLKKDEDRSALACWGDHHDYSHGY